MSSPDPTASSENTYVIDIEKGAETGRLLLQDQVFTRAMGGLFPERPDLTGVRQLLDLGCGPGGWALEVAARYPDIEVVGIDINETMIRYAFAQARTRRIENISFEVMDARKPLVFPNASFDLINARTISGFLDQESWPALLGECKRILRPGGVVRLTEVETGVSNSLATQRLGRCLTQAFARQKRTFSVDGSSLGLAHMLARLLHNAGFERIENRAFCLDSSSGTELHYSSCKDYEIAFALLKPYFIKSGIIEEAEFDQLYQTMLIDMLSDDFACISFGLTTWGHTPEV